MNALEKRNNVVGTVCIILATLCWGLSGCSGQYLLHDLAGAKQLAASMIPVLELERRKSDL